MSKIQLSDYLAWAIWSGDPMHEVCISHRIPRAWVKQEEEADTRIIVKRVVWNIEGRNVCTMSGKSPKQGLTSAEYLTIELSEDASLYTIMQ